MRILHTSDLHGNWRLPTHYEDFDVWVDSGDFIPNVSRGESVEKVFQRAWLTEDREKVRRMTMPWLRDRYGPGGSSWFPGKRRQPPSKGSVVGELTAWLKGRPAVVVGGNHDFTSLAWALKRAGAKVWDVNKGPVEIDGEVFAGFREIPYITGEWAGEMARGTIGVMQGGNRVREMAKAQPTVVVTHSPGAGVLDNCPSKGGHCGIPALSTYIQMRPNRVKLHLFGHVHEEPNIAKQGDVIYSNAAQTARIIHLPEGG